MLPHWDVLTDYMSLLAGLSVSEDAFLSSSPSCSGSDSETQDSPEIISKFNIVLMLTLFVCVCVCVCVRVYVCACVCMNIACLCVLVHGGKKTTFQSQTHLMLPLKWNSTSRAASGEFTVICNVL